MADPVVVEIAATEVVVSTPHTVLNPETINVLIHYGKNILLAVIILIIGWMISRWISNFTSKRVEKITKGDLTLASILGKIINVACLALTFIIVLGQFGVQTASLVALLGAAGLTIGLALQGTLSNVAAGVMLLIFRPFKIGDVIETDGALGKVREIGLFITQLNTPDNIRVILPNSRVWGSQIKNMLANPTRRIDLIFGISYGDDIDKAKAIILETLAAEPRILADPKPVVAVGNLGDSSVDIFVRPWVNTTEFFDVRTTMLQNIKQALGNGGVTIPFPQRDVHLFQANKE